MLQISTQNAVLDIRVTRARFEMRQPLADVRMQQKHPKVIIHKEPIEIRIDQRQCFNESGLMDLQALSDSIVQLGRQAVLEGISRISDEGNRMARFESGEDAIAEIAYDNFYPVYEFNMVTMPKSRPKIDFVGGNLDIRLDEGFVDIQVKTYNLQTEYQPGKVDIRLKQYPSISFKYTGNNVDSLI